MKTMVTVHHRAKKKKQSTFGFVSYVLLIYINLVGLFLVRLQFIRNGGTARQAININIFFPKHLTNLTKELTDKRLLTKRCKSIIILPQLFLQLNFAWLTHHINCFTLKNVKAKRSKCLCGGCRG